MKQQEKHLLIKDLYSRLPYGVKASTTIGIDITIIEITWDNFVIDTHGVRFDISQVMPYLRSMLDMTDEENRYYDSFFDILPADHPDDVKYVVEELCTYELIDWLNEHHFDYRCLITKGLALEAPKGMYKF